MLVHDLLLNKPGIALPADHGLAKCIGRHKTRLAAELTKIRLREGCSSINALQNKLDQVASSSTQHPRWIRINTILTTLDVQISTTFAAFDRVSTIGALLSTDENDKTNRIYYDDHIPNLVALSPGNNIMKSKAYKDGKLIFQDKASCFPAYLLDHDPNQGIAIDGCAAPGNKTTHLAALALERLDKPASTGPVAIACEKDKLRSQTLVKMLQIAGANQSVATRQGQNFLKLDPGDKDFATVTSLLLDPSCSGSGIVGRDEGGTTIHMPRSAPVAMKTASNEGRGKKRKHTAIVQVSQDQSSEQDAVMSSKSESDSNLTTRLASLSDFQLRLLLHAMTFPAAQRITYSTCSVHAQENEHVVCQALSSDVGRARGWRILLREDQVSGMKKWHIRGDLAAITAFQAEHDQLYQHQSEQQIADACIRCEKSGKDGTMGFFVAGFVRQPQALDETNDNVTHEEQASGEYDANDGDWDGFEDD